MDNQLWPEHEAGTTPPTHTRERITRNANGENRYLIIDDPRVPFVKKMGENLGGRWDNENRELVFDGGKRDGFDQVCDVISKMPYFEVPRSQAKFAHEEMKGLGVAFVKRPMFEQKPNQNSPSTATVWMVMAPDKSVYLTAKTAAFEKSRAKDDQVQAIHEAIATGKLTDKMIAERLGEDTVATVAGAYPINDAEELSFAISGQQLSIPAANKLLGSFLPLKEYDRGDNLKKTILEYVKEGRLTKENAGPLPIEADQLDNVTVEQAYDLQRTGKRSIGTKQRFELQKMVEVGALDRHQLKGLNTMTWGDYFTVRKTARAYMSDDVEAQFDALMQGYVEAPSKHSTSRVNAEGRYDYPVTEEEFRANSTQDIREAVKSLQDKGFKEGQPQRNGIEALRVAAASRYHLVGTNDKNEYFTLERSGKDVESPYVYTQDVTAALSEERDGTALVNKVITISGADKRFVNVSEQETIDAALCEAQARLILMDRGLKDAPNAKAPNEALEGVVQSAVGNFATALGEDKKLYTLPKSHFSNPNPTMYEEVQIKPLGASASDAVDAAEQTVAAAKRPARQKAAAR